MEVSTAGLLDLDVTNNSDLYNLLSPSLEASTAGLLDLVVTNTLGLFILPILEASPAGLLDLDVTNVLDLFVLFTSFGCVPFSCEQGIGLNTGRACRPNPRLKFPEIDSIH